MSELVRPTPSRRVLVVRGLTRACPACGRRGLTRRVVTLSPDCPRCGLVFEREAGEYIGSIIMNTIVTFGLILVSLLATLWMLGADVDFLPLVAVPLAIAAIVPPLFNPTARTLWVAISLMMTPLEPGEAIGDLVDIDAEERPPQQG